MDLFKINQLFVLPVQVFINLLCLLELIYLNFCTLRLNNTNPLFLK